MYLQFMEAGLSGQNGQTAVKHVGMALSLETEAVLTLLPCMEGQIVQEKKGKEDSASSDIVQVRTDQGLA